MILNVFDDKIKNAWIRQLREDWHTANYNFFKNKMRFPQLTLSASEGVLGHWQGGRLRCISMSIPLIQSAPWEYVQEVLYHEMAHQYVEEVLGILDEAPHGPAFKQLCFEHEIDSGARGEVMEWITGRRNKGLVQSQDHKMMDKVNKLLALAESANIHEAESAMSKAHTLLLKHNLSVLDLKNRSHYIHKQIGEVGRRSPAKSILSAILSKFFFVETIWTFGYDAKRDKRGRVLELYGTAENVEIAEYIHDTLRHISEGLWQNYKRQEAIQGNRHRRSFIYGLLNGFHVQLDRRWVENQSKNLVWKGDPALQAFFRKRNPKRVHTASRYSKSSHSAYRSGVAQGLTLVIHKGIQGKRKGALQYLA